MSIGLKVSGVQGLSSFITFSLQFFYLFQTCYNENSHMRSSLNVIYPTASEKLNSYNISGLGSTSATKRGLLFRDLILTEKSMVAISDTLTGIISKGALLGVLTGAIIGYLYALGVIVSSEMQSLFFSRTFFDLIGLSPSVSFTFAGGVTGLFLGAIIAVVSTLEVPD